MSWRELHAGPDLDKAVAERLGYTNLRVSGLTGLMWGVRLACETDHPWHIKEGVIDEPIGQWSKDIGAALMLPIHRTMRWEITQYGDGSTAVYLYEGNFPCSPRWAGDIAEQICKSWLAWQDREGERG